MENLKDDIAAKSVAVGGIGQTFGNEVAKKLISLAAKAKVLACEYVPGYEHSGERYVARFESAETANGLIKVIQQTEITEDGELYLLKFEEVPPCEVPEDWLKQVDEEKEGSHDAQPQDQPPGQQQLGQPQQGQGQYQQGPGGAAQGQGQPGAQQPGQYAGFNPYFFHGGMGQPPRFPTGQEGQRFPPPGAWGYGMPPMRPPAPGTQGGDQRQQQPGMSQFPPSMPPFMYPPYSQGQGPNAQFQQRFPAYAANYGPVSGFYENLHGPGAQPRGPPPPYNSGDQQPSHIEIKAPVESQEQKSPSVGEVVEGDQKEIIDKLERKQKQEEKRKEEDDHRAEAEGPETEEKAPSDQKTKILVKGIPQIASEDDVQNFFENRRKCGGGTVKAVRLDKDDQTAIVEFEEEEVVGRVLGKCPLLFLKKKVDIEEYMSPSEDEDSEDETFEDAPQPPSRIVKVEGLSRTTSSETLELYFENTKRSGGQDVKSVIVEEEEGVAYVTFEDPEVAKTVTEREHTVDKCSLQVSLHEPPRTKSQTSVEEQEPQCTVEVHGVPEGTSDETVEMYFENTRRSGGDDIKNMEARDGVYYITFSSEEVARRVVEHEDQVLNKTKLQVILYQPEEEVKVELCSIEVRGFSTTSEDTLEMYFENTRRSGGGDISNKEKLDDGLFLITFKSEEVAKRVVDKGKHVVEGHSLDVKLHIPETSKKSSDSTEKVSLCTVMVQGISPKTSSSTLEMYFENTRRSGGADLKSFELDEEKGVAYVTFESEEVAKAVAGREHTVEGAELTVKVYIPPPPVPMYKNKILITGKNPKTTQDCLCNFLEAKSGGVPTGFLLGEDEGTILVTFEEPPDVSKLQAACSKRALEGHKLKISKVPVSTCIVVNNLSPSTTKDTVYYYFENNRRSGGGPVTDVSVNEEEGFALVHFETPDIVDSVLKRKHKIDNSDLLVHLYLECLGRAQGDGSEPTFKPPPPLKLKNIDWHVLQFLKSSETNKDALETQVQKCHSTMKWPNSQSDPVVLECTLTTEDKGHRKLASSWAKKAESDFNDYVKLVENFELTILQDAWEKIMGELESIEIANPDGVAVFVEKSEKIIRIVGHKIPANDLRTEVESRVKKVEEELERQKMQIKESKNNLKAFQLQLLLALKYPSKMEEEFKGLKVRIKADKNEITWEGLANEVRSAQVRMYEFINSAGSSKLQKLSDGCLELYKKREVKAYIVRKLKAKQLTGVWEVSGSDLVIHALTDQEVVDSAHLIKECVVESPIDIKPASKPVLSSQEWHNKVAELEKTNSGLVKIVSAVDSLKVFIYSTDEIMPVMLETIHDFLRFRTIHEKKLKFTSGVMKFLNKYHMNEIADISKDLTQYHVQVTIDLTSFTIKGTEDGLNQAEYHLRKLAEKVKSREHEFNKPGIGTYMQSSKGQDSIKLVETQTQSVIELKSDSDDGEESFEVISPDIASDIFTHATSTTYGDRKVHAVEGDMTELKVDVIVNAADKNLNHAGGLAKAIVQKGGQVIQDECTDYVRKMGSLMEGEILASSAGKLKCSMVIHAVGPVYQGGTKNEQELLRETVFKCMERASKDNKKSIAIPGLSSGVYGYPIRHSTKIIAGAVKDFFREMQDSSLVEVFLCDVKTQNAKCFADALVDKIGKGNTQTFEQARQRPQPKPRVTKKFDSGSDDDEPPFPRGKISKLRPGSESVYPTMPSHGSKSQSFGNITVKVAKSEMARMKVDVMVNTTGKQLDLSHGAVSASLLQAGGPQLQKECTQKYPNGVQEGEVAITGPANLGCQMVLHGSLSGWDGGNKSKPLLHAFMSACLKAAEKNGMTSIAFPALGTGNLNYPKDVVAKEMFQHIADYSAQKPLSPITEVHFVVYHKDLPTVKAFEFEEQKWSFGNRGGSKTATRHVSSYSVRPGIGSDPDDDEDEEDWGGRDSARYQGNFNSSHGDSTSVIGDIRVKIYEGDITEENADCIVNSSNDALDLSRGAVSRALLKKAGQKLQDECDKKAKVAKREGLAITKGYKLKCKHVIHVVAVQTEKEWKQVIHLCLVKAEEHQIRSLAFPALGTGLKTSAEDIAGAMFSALSDFQGQNKHLKEVRMVIFQSKMVTAFRKTAQKYVGSDGAKPKSLFQKMKAGVAQTVSGLMGSWTEKAPSSDSTVNSITLVIFAESLQNINKAFEMLTTNIDKEWSTKDFRESVLKRLSDKQISEIQKLSQSKNIEVEVNRKNGHVKLSGMTKAVMDASDQIYKIIRHTERVEQEQSEANMLVNMVQWYFIEITSDGQNLEKYEPKINLLIDRAFTDQKSCVKFRDSDDIEYTLDFAQMMEYPSDSPQDTVQVIRRDILKEGSFEPPSTWAPMNDGENLKVVTLQTTDTEYTQVSQLFNASAGAGKTITKIDRIQNRTLYAQYQAKKKLLDQQYKNDQNEKQLWHGTAADTVDSINTHGFNRSYCGKNATAYGDGVYFAVQASYSSSNTYSRPDANGNKRMYLCRVLTGKYTLGKTGMRVPPPKGGANTHDLYDSVTNNVNLPGMFIIFHDTQAYPEYLLTFH